MSEWQPIETALEAALEAGPDADDIWILACRAGSKVPMVTTWDHECGRWYTFNMALEAGHHRRDPDWAWRPTHWMPLPVPPHIATADSASG